MAWRIEVAEEAEKQLRKLDKAAARRVVAYLRQLETLDNPRSRGKALTGNLGGLWRYRCGDYRVVCAIEDDKLLILALRVAHRRHVYD